MAPSRLLQGGYQFVTKPRHRNRLNLEEGMRNGESFWVNLGGKIEC